MTDNVLVAFDDDGTAVLGVMSTLQQPDTRFEGVQGGYFVLRNINVADFDTNKIFFGLIPFSLIANLFIEAEDATSTGDNVDIAGDSGTSERLDAQNEYVRWDLTAGTHLPVGRYVVLFRLKDSNQVANDAQLFVYNTTDSKYRNQENQDVHTTVTGAWAYYQLIFDIKENDVSDTDTIRIQVLKDTANANDLDVDYFLIVPIGDGESWPKDLAGVGLRSFGKYKTLSER